MEYKVYFNIDILYPKSRISRKAGSIAVCTNEQISIDEMKEDEELQIFIINSIQPKFKTGRIFNVVIGDIKPA